ncbi:RBP11-like subunits of RNA polymerase [Westerdykella ornata]|uniref:RBP11-like subunits of RNA polymerase n=1 Tax=Westerdykella ornata TaxID=318751 RepID=A0A6A6JWD9_WESOR|nr:RBP11-like subunits of RNA polymerase [Westerdykella ornata]KAF2280727.1 RBP11-like subunits of RNA polymerase [Westerdykella ornata]
MTRLTDDVPHRHESFLRDYGEKIVEVQDETRTPNTSLFTFNKEDHTLGNLISQRLHKYPFILFSAYKVPHPLFSSFELRVQTDGSITPKEAVLRCCQEIVEDLHKLKGKFNTEWAIHLAKQQVDEERRGREREQF